MIRTDSRGFSVNSAVSSDQLFGWPLMRESRRKPGRKIVLRDVLPRGIASVKYIRLSISIKCYGDFNAAKMINDKLAGGFYLRVGALAGVARRLRSNYSNSGCKLHRTLALVRYLAKLSPVQRRPTMLGEEGCEAITTVAGIFSAIYFENG